MVLSNSKNSTKSGFTLIEVVLALGVFLVSVLALIGLLAPMLQSVDEVEKLDEITSVVNTVSAFLQSSTEIAVRGPSDAITTSKFDAIYSAVSTAGGDEATIFVYRYYDDDGGAASSVRLEIGFAPSESTFVGANSVVNQPDANPANFNGAAGPIYRVVLTASPVTPSALRTDPRDPDTGIYALTEDLANYTEGYLAFEARVFAEDPPGPAPAIFNTQTILEDLNLREPDFTFNVAIVR